MYLSEEASIYMVKNIKYDISMVALKVCNKGGILNETCVSMIQVWIFVKSYVSQAIMYGS